MQREQLVDYLVDICGTRELAETYVAEADAEGGRIKTAVYALHKPYVVRDGGIFPNAADCVQSMADALGVSLDGPLLKAISDYVDEREQYGEVPLDYVPKVLDMVDGR